MMELKERATLAIDPHERKNYTLESKKYQEIYTKFCHDKGLVRYDWRTRITRVERSIDVDYGSVEVNTVGHYECSFTSMEEAMHYARKENIRFKKQYSIDELNQNIGIVLNLRKELKPIDPDQNLKDYIGKQDIKIVPVNSTDKREGTAVHLVNDEHKDMYFDKEKLATITTDLTKQEILKLCVTKNQRGENRFVYVINLNETHSTIMVIDEEEDNLKIVTAFAPKKRKIKNILKDYCIIFEKKL